MGSSGLQDGTMLANHSAGFGSSYPLTKLLKTVLTIEIESNQGTLKSHNFFKFYYFFALLLVKGHFWLESMICRDSLGSYSSAQVIERSYVSITANSKNDFCCLSSADCTVERKYLNL